jgi:hypothetical protein
MVISVFFEQIRLNPRQNHSMTWKKGAKQMRKAITALLGILTIALMLGIPAARAEAPTTTIDNNGNRIVITSGSLTATFEGMGPRVTFYDHTGLTRVEQSVNFRALIEFADTDGNKVFESNETVAKGILDEASWTHSGFYNLPSGSGVGINFTLADPIQLSPGQGILHSGSVVLIVKAYNTTTTIDVNGKPVTLNTAEVKLDFVVKDFPFQNASDMLALQVNLHSSTNHYDLEEDSGTHAVDSSSPEASDTPEHQFHETSGVEQETRFSSGTVTASTTVGFFRFVNQATVTPPTGASYFVPVTASYKTGMEDDAGANENFMKVYLAYPNFQGTLVHDPSIGLGSGFPTLFLVIGGTAIAGLAAVALIRRRHVHIEN